MRIWSVGHGTRPVADLSAVLREASIAALADVRSVPGSRRHPQFGQAPLRASLAAAGIEYVHLRGLGGRRDPVPGSVHTALRVDAFRGYAEHMSTAEFEKDFAQLAALAERRHTAFMCAETSWQVCHRRMLSDLLSVRGWEVIHLIAPGKSEPHLLWDVARRAGRGIVYDGGAMRLE